MASLQGNIGEHPCCGGIVRTAREYRAQETFGSRQISRNQRLARATDLRVALRHVDGSEFSFLCVCVRAESA